MITAESETNLWATTLDLVKKVRPWSMGLNDLIINENKIHDIIT